MKIPCGVTVLLAMFGATTVAAAGNQADKAEEGMPLLQLGELLQEVPLFSQVVAACDCGAQRVDARCGADS